VGREPPRVPGPDSRMALAVVGVAPAASGAATRAKGGGVVHRKRPNQ
jgi:hypothetical protein